MNPLPGDIFARRLRQERERSQITQAELARRIATLLGTNVDSTAVTRIEQQTRAVRLDEAVAAAQALGVPLSHLLDDQAEASAESAIAQHLAELTLAEKNWVRHRREVIRLSAMIQRLSTESEELQEISRERQEREQQRAQAAQAARGPALRPNRTPSHRPGRFSGPPNRQR